MQGVNVKSEIGNLKKVILHRPGDELLNLTPNTLEELLFDDIPFLPVAQEEHDAFANILRGEGVEVVYLEDLMAEVLDAKPELRQQFLDQWIYEAGIRTDMYHDIITDYIESNYPGNKEMVKYLISKGADVNARTLRGITPLYMAAREADADTVKLLLHAGARKDYCTNDELAPYDIAKQRGNSTEVQNLLKYDHCR